MALVSFGRRGGDFGHPNCFFCGKPVLGDSHFVNVGEGAEKPCHLKCDEKRLSPGTRVVSKELMRILWGGEFPDPKYENVDSWVIEEPGRFVPSDGHDPIPYPDFLLVVDPESDFR